MAWVRPAQPRDYDAALALLMEVHAHHVAAAPGVFQPPSPALLTLGEFTERLADPNQIVLVIEEVGALRGFAYLVHVRRPANPVFVEREYLTIEHFGVSRSHRRQGYGRQLVDAILAEATRRGLRRIELSVWAANAEAIAFYERLGFQSYLQRMDHLLED